MDFETTCVRNTVALFALCATKSLTSHNSALCLQNACESVFIDFRTKIPYFLYIKFLAKRERERQRQRQRERRERDKERQRERDRDRELDRERDIEREIQRDTETDREREREREKKKKKKKKKRRGCAAVRALCLLFL